MQINAILKTWNFKYVDKPLNTIVESIAVLLGDYEIIRKQACILLLKALVRDEFLKLLLNDNELYPFDRNDPRVKEWTNKIISKGKCEKCGSNDKLEAHHIIKWADYPQGRIDINNGICLCINCHAEEHKYDKSYYMILSKVVNKNG